MKYDDYLERVQKKYKKNNFSKSRVIMKTQNNSYTGISYKDFLDARNDIREKIREESKTAEKKTKLSVTPNKPDDKVSAAPGN
jgi:hypothetical protein